MTLHQRPLAGTETHPGWWLHKLHCYGTREHHIVCLTYYPTSIPKVPR